MGDYEVHRLVVRPEDDLVGILNNITSDTEVILREGTHTVASQITLSGLSNVSIRGSKASKISSTLNTGAPFIIEAPCSNLAFRGFTVDWSPAATGLNLGLFMPLANTGDIDDLTFDDITYFSNGTDERAHFFASIDQALSVDGLRIANCHMSGTSLGHMCLFNAIGSGEKVKNVLLANNDWQKDISVTGYWNVVFFNCPDTDNLDGVEISSNRIYQCEEFFFLNGACTACRGLIISKNYIKDSGNNDDPCIDLAVSSWPRAEVGGNIVENYDGSAAIAMGPFGVCNDNIVSECTGEGIRLTGDACSVADNVTRLCTGDGIQVNSDNNKISDNACYDSTGYGIDEDGAADGNHYTGNRCENNVAGEKRLQGTGRRQGVNYW